MSQRIFLLNEDIQALEGIEYTAASKVMRKWREYLELPPHSKVPILEYARFYNLTEDYIREKLQLD